jgi:hypothetical protein
VSTNVNRLRIMDRNVTRRAFGLKNGHIQGDSGGTFSILKGDSIGDYKFIRSYKKFV